MVAAYCPTPPPDVMKRIETNLHPDNARKPKHMRNSLK